MCVFLFLCLAGLADYFLGRKTIEALVVWRSEFRCERRKKESLPLLHDDGFSLCYWRVYVYEMGLYTARNPSLPRGLLSCFFFLGFTVGEILPGVVCFGIGIFFLLGIVEDEVMIRGRLGALMPSPVACVANTA